MYKASSNDRDAKYFDTLKCLIGVPPLIHFSNFFHPGHSYSDPTPRPPINCWGKATQTNFLKQYTYADFFAKGATRQ